MDLWQALLLGFIEGFTEFIPVSSTAHLLLVGHFLGIQSPGRTFEVLIQLGAILGIFLVYFRSLWQQVLSLPKDKQARQFLLSLILGFLPAAVLGASLHGFIKGVLFESPTLICTSLIVGGIILVMLDYIPLVQRFTDAMAFPPLLALKIGFCQSLALIPGISRSGATIVGALFLGVEKKAAAEFSFLLAIPTMFGAFTFDLYKNWHLLSMTEISNIVVGFIAAFISGIFVVRKVLHFISRHGYAPFGWWRIIVGVSALTALYWTG